MHWFHSKSLNFFYFNARSLLPKFDNLLLFYTKYSLDVICVVKTLTMNFNTQLICPSAFDQG